MNMKRLISWILCFALCFSNIVAVVSAEDTAESGVAIVSTTPEDGSMGITPMGTQMEVIFNMPMDAASLSKSTVSSEPSAISAVVLDEKNPTRCIIYFSALELDTEYKIMFSKQIKSVSGERLAKTDISFRTSAEYPKHHQVVNGDMEDKTHLNMFELAGASSKAVSYVNEGENSVLKFDPQWAGAPVGQNVYIEPGKTYEVRAKIKSTTSQMVRVIMSYVSLSEGASNWWHPIVSKTLTPDEWVEFTGSVTIPADLSYDHIRQLRITAANKNEVIYVDDWQFFETGYDVPIPKVVVAGEKQTKTYVSSGVDEALELMIGMELFDEKVLEKKDAYISRMDAAVALGKFMNWISADSKGSTFVDLAGVKNAGMVSSLADQGIILGYGKYFYPNNNISYSDVIKAVSTILGYDMMLQEYGYVYTASRLNLNTGVLKTSGSITYSEFAKIISNAADVAVMDNDGNGKYTISNQKARDVFLRIYKGKGIISATEYSDLYGIETASDAHVIINDEQYKVTCDTYGWEGRNVEYYYKVENDEKIIVHIAGLSSLNHILTLDYADISSYSSNKYYYYDANENIKTARVVINKKFIYNGKALSRYTVDDMKPSYGNVQLIDNNRDGVYDIVRVENLDTYVVHAVNHTEYKIYDEYETKTLDLGNSNKIIVEENGESSKFGNITIGSVVSAAVSKDNSVAKLYLSKTTLEGSIGEFQDNTTEIEMSIYDEIHQAGIKKTFQLHPLYQGAYNARTNADNFIGENVVVLFDYTGCAVAVNFVGGSAWKWAYLLEAKLINKSFDYEVLFKIFSEEGVHSITPAAQVVRVNGIPKKAEKIIEALENGAAQMLRIRFNSNGEISEVVTAGSEEKNLKKFTGSNYTYFSTIRSLGYKVALTDTSIPVFSVPSSLSGAEDYQFVCSTASSYLINEKKYNFEAYSCDGNDLNVECIVLKDREVKNTDSWNIGVITQIVDTIDEDGEVYQKITVQNSSSNYTAKVYADRIDITNLAGAATGSGLTARLGDIVMYQNNAQGLVNTMKLLYSASGTGTLYTSSNPSGTAGSAYRAVAGKVLLNQNGYIQLLPHNMEDNAENYEVFNAGQYSKVLCVDSTAGNKVSTVQTTEIYDRTCSDDGVNIVVVSAWGGATLMVIYR